MDHDERWQRRFEASQHRLQLKERAIAYMGGRCSLCPYDKCPAAMVFHHLDPREKDFNISSRMSWKSIERELQKCVLLCSNCHAEVHSGYHPLHLVQDDNPYPWD